MKAGATAFCSTVVFASLMAPSAFAACSSTAPASNTAVLCSSTASAVTAQTGSTGVAITVDATATGNFARATSPVAISVESASSIDSSGILALTGGGGSGTVRGAVLLGNVNDNRITHAAGGTITTTGAFNDGMAANGSGNTLTNNGSIATAGPSAFGMTAAWGQTNQGQLNNAIVNTGSVSTAGSNARAASILGGSGTVTNSGTLSTTGASSPAVYMQGNNDQLVNSGTITASGNDSDAVFSNTASAGFVATIQNLAGGRIISQTASAVRTLNGASTVTNAGLIQGNSGSAIAMGNGNDALILQTGSVIVGGADGGAGTNTVTLQGSGTADNAFTNYQTLTMQGTLWRWTGSGTFTQARVQSGTLDLVGTLGPSTSALVDAGATLQANAQNLPLDVTDNGLVRFAQDIDGSYAGLISGNGSVTKAGAGQLTLAPAAPAGNGYAGGTRIEQGVLAVGADNALGAAGGGLAFGGGTLQLGSSFDLAATRPIVLDAGGGTIDTQSFASTLLQPVTGVGALTKTGAGELLMNGASSYAGGTTIAAGTLAVGDAAHANAALAGGGPIAVAAGATLGGYGSVTGAVTNLGTLAVADALPRFAGGAKGSFTVNGSLINAGLVQLGGRGAGNQLIVAGNYVGQAGTIAMNTVVGADNSATDRVVISGGTGTGATRLNVSNVGGTGAQTAVDGIQVVAATNGATTSNGAFTLAAPIRAGAFTYYLAKGGVTAGTQNNWYLRNTVAALPPTAAPPTLPGTPPPSSPGTPPALPDSAVPGVPVAAEGTPPLPAPPAPGAAPTALYRPEVPLYASVAGVARQLGLLQIGSFHERQGDQALLTESGRLPATWARVWGGRTELRRAGTVDPGFDGSTYGAQAGQDLYADAGGDGHHDHVGVLAGYARSSGDVDGFALGTPRLAVGQLAVESTSLGAYWTHVGPGGWYTDTVLMGSSLRVDAQSSQFSVIKPKGSAVTASVEGGIPFAVGAGLTLEPQAQLIWQRLSIDDANDGVSSVRFDNGRSVTGRLGVRLQGRYDAAGVRWQPFVRLSILRSSRANDTVTFGGATDIGTGGGQTSAQLGAGVVVKLSAATSAYVNANAVRNLGGTRQRVLTGNAGLRWTW